MLRGSSVLIGLTLACFAAPVSARRHACPRNGLYEVAVPRAGIRLLRGRVRGVGVHEVEVDLAQPDLRVTAAIAQGGIGRAESFGCMMSRCRPAAAITGTFFGMRDLLPTGDLVIDGRPVYRGCIGTAIAVTKENQVFFIRTRRGPKPVDWSCFETVVRAGPVLVEHGRLVLAPREEGFRTLPVSQPRARTALGLTKNHRLMLVATREGISLWQLAKVMRALGARDAVTLDGGTSTALYAGGQTLIRPGRSLTNVLMVCGRDKLARSR